jgi:DNA-binding XRE family transcriptional regulator
MPLRCDLKTILHRKKMSQKNLAKAIKVTEQTVSYWANDVVVPKLETALLVSDALKVSVNEIWVLIKDEKENTYE